MKGKERVKIGGRLRMRFSETKMKERRKEGWEDGRERRW